jgi:TonB family protein
MKAGPAFKSGPDAVFPDAAKAAGAHGKVIVRGIIGADGRFGELQVAVSSKSDLLGASAIAAASASVFEPAKDAAGAPIGVPATMPFEFENAKTPGKGGGVLRYRCGQFARDEDWWKANWPAEKYSEFYYLTLGLSSIAKSRGTNGAMDIKKFVEANKDFGVRWQAVVEACRATPDKLFIDVFKPEGDWMRRLAERS